MMTPGEMERRIRELERKVPTGPGTSTAFGQSVQRVMQPGFAAKITAAYVEDEGYEWERRVTDLTQDGVVDVTTPLTGKYAFTPDNNKTLPVGALGWMEPDPAAQGWVFVPTAGDGFLRLIVTDDSSGVNTTDATWKPASVDLNSVVTEGATTADYSAVWLPPLGGTLGALDNQGSYPNDDERFPFVMQPDGAHGFTTTGFPPVHVVNSNCPVPLLSSANSQSGDTHVIGCVDVPINHQYLLLINFDYTIAVSRYVALYVTIDGVFGIGSLSVLADGLFIPFGATFTGPFTKNGHFSYSNVISVDPGTQLKVSVSPFTYTGTFGTSEFVQVTNQRIHLMKVGYVKHLATCSETPCESGTGSGPTPDECSETSITVTALGTASGTDAGDTATAMAEEVTVPGCATLIVHIGMVSDGGTPGTDSVTFAGIEMTALGPNKDLGGAGVVGSQFVFYYRPLVTTTGNIVLSVSGGTTNTAALITASYVTGLTPDLDVSSTGNGASSNPNSGTTGTTATAAEYATAAAFMTDDVVGTGTWQNSFAEVQRVSAGGVILAEAYRILGATTTVNATISAFDATPDQWSCVVGTIA